LLLLPSKRCSTRSARTSTSSDARSTFFWTHTCKGCKSWSRLCKTLWNEICWGVKQRSIHKNFMSDTVVASCVFCSVPDPVQGLKEIRRVSRPGGQILMLEHVRSHKPVLGPIMDGLNFLPLSMYGANFNRETEDNLLKAGFSRQEISVTNLWMDVFKAIRIQNMKHKEASPVPNNE